MKTQALIEFFGSQQKAADALGISQPTIARYGEFPPPWRQLQAEAVTAGKLRAEPACDKYRVPAAKAA